MSKVQVDEKMNHLSLDLIYHYTSIDTLELILKNHTIRFNRLDQVPDLSESNSFTKLKLGNFFFISCWTKSLKESIPLWQMHSQAMTGVRIGFVKQLLFNYKPVKIPSKYKDEIKQTGEYMSPIPFERMCADNYFILPMFVNRKYFEREVKYSTAYKKIKNDAIKVEIKENGIFKSEINDPTGIAAVKSPEWEFEEEIRFVLFIMPSVSVPQTATFEQYVESFTKHLGYFLYNGIGPNIIHFDVNIDPMSLDNIMITTGPRCSESDFQRVEQLVKQYSSKGKVQKSKLEGTIRK